MRNSFIVECKPSFLLAAEANTRKRIETHSKTWESFRASFPLQLAFPFSIPSIESFTQKKRKKRKQDSCQSNGQTRSWLLIREIKIQLHPKKEPRFIFFVCLLVSFRSGLIDMRLVYDYQKLLLYYSYYSSTVCPRSFGRSQVVSEQIFNRQYYFSSFYWFHYQTSALFFFSFSFPQQSSAEEEEGKEKSGAPPAMSNKYRLAPCVCVTQRSRLDARATGAIRHPGHQRVLLLLQLCSSISPLLTNKKPKLDKRERDTRRDSQAVLLTQNPLPVFSLIPDSLFKLLFFFFFFRTTRSLHKSSDRIKGIECWVIATVHENDK